MIKIPNLIIPEWDTTQYEGGSFSNRFISNDSSDTQFSNLKIPEDFDLPVHVFSSDHFRMFEFKVRQCQRARSHDWTECPYSHPGEKARRRDPRKVNYSGTPCSEFRRLGNCTKGDSCYFAHGVFECWLHPSRYRTQLCNDGIACRRRVCFFAHTIDQLRISGKGSPETFVSSPTSVLESPPGYSRYGDVPVSVRDRVGCLRGGLFSLPSRYVGVSTERVESGKDLRVKIYGKFNEMNSNDSVVSVPVPDFGWVSELVN